ncbi:4915_t:CDS:2 [Cetraspora pellucida]|uniref:Autophagy-related protein n=1 Tax=Cetraspora pellucida TaxID=1433469 RepID=A0A9N8Z4R5_9GLOM|nr:4915_t:CDS:2 [Cetraspora pellucida]
MNLDNSDEESNSSIVKKKLTPLTKRESIGWYFLCAASGIYGGAPIGASRAGYELDQVTPCNTTVANYNCVVRFGTGFIDTNSYSLYIISISVFVQTILFISCGSLADHGNMQKMFALLYGFIGAITTILFITVTSPQQYLLAGIFAIISNCCYGATNIFTIAYIPIFARNHPKIIDAKNSDMSISEIKFLEDKMTVKLSSNSLISAFFAIMIIMFAAGGILALLKGSPYAIQIALAFAGKTLSSTRSLWQTMKCLFGWFLLSDGVSTLIVVGVLFSRKQLGLNDAEISIITSLAPIFEIFGIFMLLYLQKLFHLTEKTLVVISSIFASVLPLYVILGFWLPFGLNNKWEIWMYLIWFGIAIGSINNYCRALFAIIIPIGHENEFFSLYQMTAKDAEAFSSKGIDNEIE